MNVSESQPTNNVNQSTSTENLGMTAGPKVGEKNIDESIKSLAPKILKDIATVKEQEVYTPLGVESEMQRQQNQSLSSPSLTDDEELALLEKEEEMAAQTAQEYQSQMDEITSKLSHPDSLAEEIEKEEPAEGSVQESVLERSDITNQKTHETAIQIMSEIGSKGSEPNGRAMTPALGLHDIVPSRTQVQGIRKPADHVDNFRPATTRRSPPARSDAEAHLVRKLNRDADLLIGNYQFSGSYSIFMKEMLREKLREKLREVIVEDRPPNEIANELANLFKPSSNHTFEFLVPSEKEPREEEPSEVQEEAPSKRLEQKPRQEKLLVLVPPSRAEKYKDLHKDNKDNIVIRDGKEVRVEVHYLTEKEHEELQSDIAQFIDLVHLLVGMLAVTINAKKNEKEENIKQSPDTEVLKTPEKLKDSEAVDPIVQEAIKKLKERGLSKDIILEILVKEKRVWDKKMLDQFIKQIETELRITKEEIKKIIQKDIIKTAEVAHEEKDEFTLKEPELYSRFNDFVNKLYEKSVA